LYTLRRGHPRILANAADFDRVRALSEQDPTAARWREAVRREADALVGQPPTVYAKIGPRLQFFDYKKRVVALGMAWRLEGDPRYARQAQRELLAAARYPDWNPSHYLDTAEMTAATATGYSWVFEGLARDARRTVRRAIVGKGLRTSLCQYARGLGPVHSTSNWGIVTNAGLAIGALAVADTHPRLAATVLDGATTSIRPALAGYGRDGAYAEGPGYWRYATEHAVKLVATLDAALGRDFELASTRGFARTGAYALHNVGPTGQVANFADTRPRLRSTAHLYWLARRFGRPVDAWLARRQAGRDGSPLHLLWYSPAAVDPDSAGVARARVFARPQTAHLRGQWRTSASFVALKGGTNAVPHAQPELGSFVLDAAGRRWGVDLGLDDYNLPGYWDWSTRSRYYRLSTAGQNTLVIDGDEQPRDAYAPVTHLGRERGRSEAVVDLSEAYPVAASARRGVALLDDRDVLVQDEVVTGRPTWVYWTMHTRARITISDDGKRAVLRRDGRRLVARILAPSDATAQFIVASAARRAPEATNAGVSRLMVRTYTTARDARRASRLRLTVLLSPDALPETLPAVASLAAWAKPPDAGR
ncbi:MAG: heparinase II/III-family protein, partial [Actinomycetota bacterium]|nr:heparinase II/III-family protein [Actinomycetota bacterium]